MAVSDASGDAAIIESLNGKPVIPHGRQYQVMTNSPIDSDPRKLNAYWTTRDRNQERPGSIHSPDRLCGPPPICGSCLPQRIRARPWQG